MRGQDEPLIDTTDDTQYYSSTAFEVMIVVSQKKKNEAAERRELVDGEADSQISRPSFRRP